MTGRVLAPTSHQTTSFRVPSPRCGGWERADTWELARGEEVPEEQMVRATLTWKVPGAGEAR